MLMIIMMNHQLMMFRAFTHIREKRPIQVIIMNIMIYGGGDETDDYMEYNHT